MSKTILMVAFDFPPSNAASVQRTLSFYKHLNELGWNTIMLTAKEDVYSVIDKSYPMNMNENQSVFRTKALDIHKHFSIKGKHLSWMKIPDQYNTWILSAIFKGGRIIKDIKPDVIWSTCPIPSAHVIANALSTKYNIPWVAEYRDPPSYIHKSKGVWADFINNKISMSVLNKAHKIIFATEETKKAYLNYHKNEKLQKAVVIENGYNQDNFDLLCLQKNNETIIFSKNKTSLYYSGVLYKNGRSPLPLFDAILNLKQKNIINESNFELIFQGAGNGTEFQDYIDNKNLTKLIFFKPSVPFLQALYNMTTATSLVLIQDAIFNLQIPSKVYEYIKVNKPILAMTPSQSATSQLLGKAGCGFVAENSSEIETYLNELMSGSVNVTTSKNLSMYSRVQRSEELNDVLNSIVSCR